MEQATEAGLDPGVLEHVAEPGDLADALLSHFRAVADHIPGRLDLRRGDEAAGQQAALQQVHQPLGVGEIRFAARHVLDMPGVAHQHLLEVPVLDQRVINRHGIDERYPGFSRSTITFPQVGLSRTRPRRKGQKRQLRGVVTR